MAEAKEEKKMGLLQHCSGHTQPMSVVFKVCTYRSKSQLGNLGFVARVKGAEEPKPHLYRVTTLLASCGIALISLKYQVLARGKVLNSPGYPAVLTDLAYPTFLPSSVKQ